MIKAEFFIPEPIKMVRLEMNIKEAMWLKENTDKALGELIRKPKILQNDTELAKSIYVTLTKLLSNE